MISFLQRSERHWLKSLQKPGRTHDCGSEADGIAPAAPSIVDRRSGCDIELCRFPQVAFQQTAEALFASDIGPPNRIDGGRQLARLLGRRVGWSLVLQTLMRAFQVVVLGKLGT